MIALLYVVLLVVFGALLLFTLADFWTRYSALRQEAVHLRERQEEQEERLRAMQQELDDLEIDLEFLEQEKASLEAQRSCMKNLDRLNLAEVSDREIQPRNSS